MQLGKYILLVSAEKCRRTAIPVRREVVCSTLTDRPQKMRVRHTCYYVDG